ncbi:MAG: transmembrane protein [Microgenomates bacterium 39_6]|nr:MAG: transmembrane protein [Microgenomates bacterium 39_6]
MKKVFNFFKKINSSLVSIMVLVLLVFIPLYPKLPSLEIPGSYVRVRLEDFVVAITFLAALPLIWQKRKTLFKNKISQAIIVYWLVGLAATISALFVSRLIWPHLACLHYLRRIEYMALFFLGFLAVRNKKDFKTFLIVLMVVTTLVFLYALGQKFYSLPAISTMNEEFSKGSMIELDVWTRVSSTFAGHYDLAIFMTLIIPICFSFFLTSRKKSQKIFLAGLFVACYYLLILTASRISFVAYLVSISFLLIVLNKKWWLPPVIALSLLGSFFSEDINQRFSATIKVEGPKLVQRVGRQIESFLPEEKQKELAQKRLPTPTPTITKEEEIKKSAPPSSTARSVSSKPSPTPTPTPTPQLSRQQAAEVGVTRSGDIRFSVEWPRAIRHFKKNPLLGTGYSSLTLATDNGYLRALGETGILGLLALLGIFLAQVPLYQKLLQDKQVSRQNRALGAALASGTIAILASMLFIDALESSKVAFSYWLILGLVVGRVNLETKNNHE